MSRSIDNFSKRAVRVSETPNDREIAVAGLLLRHLQLLQFNAHEVFETRLGNEHRFRGSRPLYIGVAIYPTVARFNHDCYPAVTRYPTALAIPTDRSLYSCTWCSNSINRPLFPQILCRSIYRDSGDSQSPSRRRGG